MAPTRAMPIMQTKEELATALNPAIGYFDPLGLGSADFWSQGNEKTYAFLRHAEIKHGRVAMAAFVGFIVQSNGLHWPFPMTPTFEYNTALTPPEQWDALPFEGKWQIIAFIGFLEWWGEFGGQHYMAGGKPGDYPDFKDIPLHKMPSLYDPAGLSKKMSAEKKEERLLMEINNGRLAQIGIMGFLAAEKVPGSVPFLTNIVAPYSGDVMQPF
eukprot:CAMPEP_0119069338 /NCGR_PEP_ID=MMETSP1178-20130426/13754_1 /TAXON_ID=33656 /ORGANISM="unid sp, Strain CCMP2000" /LENGTH=212 /DNA_ID=CAMNT_0007051095 /DNA_START=75 /DNA_END=713 /DNA_ORIENTATION=+